MAAETENKFFDPVVFIMPSDEDIFEIDANLRTINVPNSFKHGVAVQGDNLSEILYFSIDRYFDTMDLANTHVIVQWHKADSEDSYLSATINNTLSLVPEKLVFGWPITEEMTSTPGNIEFSIRFYLQEKDTKTGEEFLKYSFGTRTATIKINSSLDFQIEDEDLFNAMYLNYNDRIYGNIQKSHLAGLAGTATMPIFEIPLEAVVLDIPEEGFIELTALAYPEKGETGMGEINYTWSFSGKNENNQLLGAGEEVYFNTKDSTKQDNNIYYYLKDGVWTIYNEGSEEESFDAMKHLLFEKGSKIKAEKAGIYTVTAQNFYAIGSTAEKSITYTIPYAKEVLIKYKEDYSDVSKIIMDATQPFTIGFELAETKQDYGIYNQDGGQLSYAWAYSPSQLLSAAIEDAEKISLEGSNIIEVSNGTGYYFLTVTNTKNNDIEIVELKPIRVTGPVPMPAFKYKIGIDGAETSWPNPAVIEAPHGATIYIIEDNSLATDQIKYSWKVDGNEVSSNNNYTIGNEDAVNLTITNYYNNAKEDFTANIYRKKN